jgi:hypothetical protein
MFDPVGVVGDLADRFPREASPTIPPSRDGARPGLALGYDLYRLRRKGGQLGSRTGVRPEGGEVGTATGGRGFWGAELGRAGSRDPRTTW